MTINDIGDWGSKRGRPVEVYISPINSFLGSLQWLILIAAFLIFKENRNKKALWILLPMFIAYFIWWIIIKTLPLNGAGQYFEAVVNSTVLSLVLTWLMAEKLAKVHRFFSCILTFLIFVAIAVIDVISFGENIAEILIIFSIVAGIFILSPIMARWMCRRQFKPVRFVLFTLLNTILVTTVFFLTTAIIQSIANGTPITNVIGQVLLITIIFGGICFVFILPFELLLIINKFWRVRFLELFRYPLESPKHDQDAC